MEVYKTSGMYQRSYKVKNTHITNFTMTLCIFVALDIIAQRIKEQCLMPLFESKQNQQYNLFKVDIGDR